MNFLDQLAARLADASTAAAPGAGTAAMGVAQSPTVEADIEASSARAEHAGDGPDVEAWVSPRQLIDYTYRLAVAAERMTHALTPPVPTGSVAIQSALPDGVPVQVLPPSGGRPRRAVLRNVNGSSASVSLSPDQRADSTGYLLADGAELETNTQGAVWAYISGGTSTVVAWVDHYGAP